ncbi:hypothetical protein PWG14_28040, partial [Chromobacterium amazonense]|uniref:hypothetical protein n=1 Tax=Chromobacterium amazonense TaxID=1382803 RepID=UPI00237D89E0
RRLAQSAGDPCSEVIQRHSGNRPLRITGAAFFHVQVIVHACKNIFLKVNCIEKYIILCI